MLDNYNPLIIIRLLRRWCWNWQTGVVEGHVPLGREGSTPSQRTKSSLIILVLKLGLFFYLCQNRYNPLSLRDHTCEQETCARNLVSNDSDWECRHVKLKGEHGKDSCAQANENDRLIPCSPMPIFFSAPMRPMMIMAARNYCLHLELT